MFENFSAGTQYMLTQLIQFFMQLVLFTAIPLIWYLVTKKKDSESFIRYVGLQEVPLGAYGSAFLITGAAYIFTLAYFVILRLGGGMETVPLREAYGASPPFTFVLTVLWAGLRAGICEELLFRGFIGKRLIRRLGFGLGNVLQAVLFMVPYLISYGFAPTFESIGGMLNAGVMGYAFGYIMHKKADGSILPSMVVHILVDVAAVPISLLWL